MYDAGSKSLGARSYRSQLGRFLTPEWSADPEPVPYADLTNPQTLNRYAYAGNNPTTNTDADGHREDVFWITGDSHTFDTDEQYGNWRSHWQGWNGLDLPAPGNSGFITIGGTSLGYAQHSRDNPGAWAGGAEGVCTWKGLGTCFGGRPVTLESVVPELLRTLPDLQTACDEEFAYYGDRTPDAYPVFSTILRPAAFAALDRGDVEAIRCYFDFYERVAAVPDENVNSLVDIELIEDIVNDPTHLRLAWPYMGVYTRQAARNYAAAVKRQFNQEISLPD